MFYYYLNAGVYQHRECAKRPRDLRVHDDVHIPGAQQGTGLQLLHQRQRRRRQGGECVGAPQQGVGAQRTAGGVAWEVVELSELHLVVY